MSSSEQLHVGLDSETVQHTSASLTINENYNSDVLEDVEMFLNGTVPEVRAAETNKLVKSSEFHLSYVHLILSCRECQSTKVRYIYTEIAGIASCKY